MRGDDEGRRYAIFTNVQCLLNNLFCLSMGFLRGTMASSFGGGAFGAETRAEEDGYPQISLIFADDWGDEGRGRIFTTDIRINTDEESDAGTTGARSGGVFAGPLPSELEDGPSKLPLHSLCESPASAC